MMPISMDASGSQIEPGIAAKHAKIGIDACDQKPQEPEDSLPVKFHRDDGWKSQGGKQPPMRTKTSDTGRIGAL